jgi:hypothetical protein
MGRSKRCENLASVAHVRDYDVRAQAEDEAEVVGSDIAVIAGGDGCHADDQIDDQPNEIESEQRVIPERHLTESHRNHETDMSDQYHGEICGNLESRLDTRLDPSIVRGILPGRP